MFVIEGGRPGSGSARAISLVLLVLWPGTAGATTFGQPDGNRHPQVGAVLYNRNPDSPGPDVAWTGTLIAPTIFLTASHCFEADGQRVAVSFASDYDEDAARPAGIIRGTAQTHPLFGAGGASDTHDIAVIVLLRDAALAVLTRHVGAAGDRREVAQGGVGPVVVVVVQPA